MSGIVRRGHWCVRAQAIVAIPLVSPRPECPARAVFENARRKPGEKAEREEANLDKRRTVLLTLMRLPFMCLCVVRNVCTSCPSALHPICVLLQHASNLICVPTTYNALTLSGLQIYYAASGRECVASAYTRCLS